jgi:hypothetical protein
LAVGIKDDDYFTMRCPYASFDTGTIAHIVWPADDGGACCFGLAGGIVTRGIVDHDDFGIGHDVGHTADYFGNSVGFVVGWDNHTNRKRPTLWL